ncbi:1983_t:CDS:10 [Ambispora gerdemannii]|uniref:tRNA dimethylallyltransferase n=1 Tax=Ambispora gerdemannii TaxID=144530 RepID=A0A9N8V133_9GLOM|nr:1983_t:CDS:10 [Ambispora gerdemannii]
MNKCVVAIIGTTGVGKSDLGVQLAKAFNGEVINGDSMQVYKGLDIITNKITVEERDGVPHHLMDFLEPHQEYRVTEFTKDALRLIDEIHSRNHLPIIVGGTHYYIQSLLWKNSLVSETASPSSSSDDSDDDCYNENSRNNDGDDDKILNADTSILYKRLQEVDPVMANRWHWNDRRKIRRSLQIYLRTGKRHSEWIDEQHQPEEKANSPRFPRMCIFWLYADPEYLKPRLDARVDKMIEKGLFDEIRYLRNQLKLGQQNTPTGDPIDYTRGIWQAIGYKEFDPYLSSLERVSDSLGDITPTQQDEILKQSCTNTMKAVTRRYARRQVRWIRNKFLLKLQQQQLPSPSPQSPSEDANIAKLYLLDATSLDTWIENVCNVAINITKEFMNSGTGPDPTQLNSMAAEILSQPIQKMDNSQSIHTWKKYQCEICTKFANISGPNKPLQDDKTDQQQGGNNNETLSFSGTSDSCDNRLKSQASHSPPPLSSPNLPVTTLITLNGPTEWKQHLKSKWHKSNVRLLKEMNEKWGGELPPWFHKLKNDED